MAEPELREQKRAIRRAARARRAALDPTERETHSAAVIARLIQMPEFTRARTVMMYWAMGDEVDTRPLAWACHAAGVRVVLPRVVRWEPAGAPAPDGVYGRGGRGLALHLFTGEAGLAPGPFGLSEPVPEAPPVRPDELDLMVIPGVAFDRSGGRIGYGGGFYDGLLAVVPARVARVAVAFGCQLVDDVPRGREDRGVDAVVTERGVIRAGV